MNKLPIHIAMFNVRNIITLLLLIACDKCLCDMCKTCVCSSNTGRIIDCHDRNLGINEDWFNFDFYTLNQHRPLNELILSKNNITLLPTNELRNLKHLKKLDLSQNQLDNMHSEVLRTLINLEDLNYSHNLLWNFDISILETSLVRLNLSCNRINNLEKNSENTTILKVLDVSHNNITNLSFLEALLELEYLDLSFNRLTTLPANLLLHLERLKILYVNNNQLLSLNLQNFPQSLLELYAGSNIIDSLSFQSSPIRIFDIKNNRISKIHKNVTLLEKIISLNISSNFLSDFPDVSLKTLETLDLSYNELTLVPDSVCIKNFPSLKILRINGGHLKDVKLWSELRLEKFEVSFADAIERIEEETFHMLRERKNGCINIIISNNIKLSTIHENAFQHMNICSIDLSNNHFTYLPPKLFDVNIYNRNISNAEYLINLQGNPFICDCSLQWMLSELVPKLYVTKPSLLEDLRCAGPPPLSNKRIVHWYKWKGKVFCDDFSHFAERITVNVASVSSNQVVTFKTSPGMIAVLVTTIALLAILTIIGILLTRKMIAKKRRVNRRF
ncbi:Malignant fibrous histiocytoma-amplified sequence [Ooceraea biroi]|uniref:Malignant fibrous histiocytoma-amplified sequence n=1 Tax=Ooceraea biroi TaxID=2015173 RepID=A0A026W4T7_OOCBI|nr:Malignant fibrous histiocytoma-amplified sequence [Ooceraea biroi]